MLKVISPGTRFIASIGDTSPPNTEFERLVYIGDQIEKLGRLPLEAGSYNPIAKEKMIPATAGVTLTKKISDQKKNEDPKDSGPAFHVIQKDVLSGDGKKLIVDVQQMLDLKFNAKDILNIGMLSAMEILGEKFKDGTVFIPEVLLSARAMNEALVVLEPHLAGDQSRGAKGKILIAKQ